MDELGPPVSELRFPDLPEPGSRFQLGNKLGSGVSGIVYEASDNKAGRKVAIKVIHLSKENESEIREEYRVLRELSQHENLPDFYGIFLKKDGSKEQVWLVMELCGGGTAVNLVHGVRTQNKKMSEAHIAYILREIIKGIVHLHDHRVIHRDVRGCNVLLTADGRVKLADFGLSRRIKSSSDKANTCIGSPCWMAPEVVTAENGSAGAGYDNRVDVWATGITAIELGDGQAPFQDIHPARALFQIVRNPPPTLYRPANWSQLYNDFINECLEKNKENRPYAEELLEHPFFENVNENVDSVRSEIQSLIGDSAPFEPKKPEVMIKRGYLRKEQEPLPEKLYQEDLAALEHLTEDAVLTELHERLKRKQFHTFVGDVLLVLNPNEKHNVYGKEDHLKYQFKARSDNAPHVYSVADSAYQDVLHHEEPQHILLAGETLSGKTTTMMHIMDHLLFLGRGNPCGENVRKAMAIIHALGNAGTPLNSNSTRNLLQTQLTFTNTGKVSGAIFWVYLLEKTRITFADRRQANFHLFYYFYDAMESEGALSRFRLKSGRNCSYLRTKAPTGKPGPRENSQGNVERFLEFEGNMRDLGFENEHLETIKDILAAILLLGEVNFQDGEDGHAMISNQDVVTAVAGLLNLDEKKFSWSLLNYCVITKGEAVRRRQSKDEAMEARDVLARGFYFRLVDWVVNHINEKLSIPRAIYGDRHVICLMDLFGFECNTKNAMEQLYINTVNEQLQFHYNQRVFNWEIGRWKRGGKQKGKNI